MTVRSIFFIVLTFKLMTLTKCRFNITDYYPTEVIAVNATLPLSNSLLSSRTLIGSKVLVSPLESAEPVY